jgi:hypothetical protein
VKKYLLILSLLFLFSCKKTEVFPESNFRFLSPQPINDSELSKIPNKFLGVFMNKDSTYLNINSNSILSEKYARFKVNKSMLDSLKTEFSIQNGKYILKESKQIYDSKIVGDSIELSLKNIDTLFVLSNSQKAKRINGHLIISQKESFYWNSKILTLDDNVLKIREVYSEKDRIRLDSLTTIKSKEVDSATFLVEPTRPEFSKILKLKNFGFEQQFNKITNE